LFGGGAQRRLQLLSEIGTLPLTFVMFMMIEYLLIITKHSYLELAMQYVLPLHLVAIMPIFVLRFYSNVQTVEVQTVTAIAVFL
jgi:hypothetical protein